MFPPPEEPPPEEPLEVLVLVEVEVLVLVPVEVLVLVEVLVEVDVDVDVDVLVEVDVLVDPPAEPPVDLFPAEPLEEVPLEEDALVEPPTDVPSGAGAAGGAIVAPPVAEPVGGTIDHRSSPPPSQPDPPAAQRPATSPNAPTNEFLAMTLPPTAVRGGQKQGAFREPRSMQVLTAEHDPDCRRRRCAASALDARAGTARGERGSRALAARAAA